MSPAEDRSSGAEGGRSDAGGPVPVGRLSVPKSADVLAARLRDLILRGEIEEGRPISPERELAEQSGVSRVTVRAALRTLQAEGLVDIRPGRSGGAFVKRPGNGEMARSVDLFVRGGRLRLESITEVRAAVEPGVAALAARNRTDEELEHLTRVHTRSETLLAKIPANRKRVPASVVERLLQDNLEWHLAVVAASHNDLLIAFLNGLSTAISEATNVDTVTTREALEEGCTAHSRIMDAIRAGDAPSARRRMERHLDSYCAQTMSDTLARDLEVHV